MKATALVVLPNVDHTPTLSMQPPSEGASQRMIQIVVGFRRSRYRGLERTGFTGYLVATAYNLERLANLLRCEQTRTVQSAIRSAVRSNHLIRAHDPAGQPLDRM